MTRSELVSGLLDYEMNDIRIQDGGIQIWARYGGVRSCPHCGGERLRNKGRYERCVHYENWGLRHCVVRLEACKWHFQS